MNEQLDLFSENKAKCQHCRRHVPPHFCWRCGGVVDCTADKFGSQKLSYSNPPGLAAIVGYGQRPESSYECFDCNHAVAEEQLAWAWHVSPVCISRSTDELDMRTIPFLDALDRVRRRLAVKP